MRARTVSYSLLGSSNNAWQKISPQKYLLKRGKLVFSGLKTLEFKNKLHRVEMFTLTRIFRKGTVPGEIL